MKILKRVWEAITMPFLSIAVGLDESRRQNLDGSWDKYWERKNRKAMKKRGCN